MVEKEKPQYSWRQKRMALARQLRPYKNALIGLSVGEVLIAAGNGVIPYITGKFFDTLITPHILLVPTIGSTPAWAVLLGAWALIQLATNGVNWLIDRRTRLLTTELEAGVQARGFSFLLTLPISFHKKRRTGEVMDTVGRSGWMTGSLLNTVLSIAPQLLTLFIGVGISFALRPSLALVLLAGVALYLVMLIRVLPSTTLRQEEAWRIWREAHGDAADAYENVSTVKQANAEQYESVKITAGFFDRAIPSWYRMERLWSTLGSWQRLVVMLTQGAIFLFSVSLVAHGKITIGDLIAFNAYASMIIGPFITIGNQWQTVQNALTVLASLDEILQMSPEVYDPKDAVRLPTIHGDVAFDDVHFKYEPDQPEVLSGMTFTAKAGEVVALVGETGAGKSTTAELISGYYFPTSGTVTIDGADITRVNLNDLRSRIAVVPQEVVLFNASIKDNIRYGRPEATDADVEEAARRAHADAYIEKFPKKYEQVVGERGVKLSVGQKQRVAIARAMLRNPSILILDEPTSALDVETERFITTSLEELMRGRTTFIIAHRLSTVRQANRILVLENGRIAESGTHNELIARGGHYARLYNLHIGLHE